MQHTHEALYYLIETEKQSYQEYVSQYYSHLLQDNQDLDQCLNIGWIQKNLTHLSHIYISARLAQEEVKYL